MMRPRTIQRKLEPSTERLADIFWSLIVCQVLYWAFSKLADIIALIYAAILEAGIYFKDVKMRV